MVHPGFLRTPLRTPRSEHYRCWSGPGPMSRSHTGSVTHILEGCQTRFLHDYEEAGAACHVSRFVLNDATGRARNVQRRDGRRIASDSERDEAIAPKRFIWPPPALLQRCIAGYSRVDGHSPGCCWVFGCNAHDTHLDLL